MNRIVERSRLDFVTRIPFRRADWTISVRAVESCGFAGTLVCVCVCVCVCVVTSLFISAPSSES